MTTPLTSSERAKIERAIAAAEAITSGELRVVFSPAPVADPVAAAEAEFARLGMHHTQHRNAVLIFVAPSSHAFAIFGDREVHARCGQGFWDEVSVAMGDRFRQGALAEGIVLGIERAGELLAKEFPRAPDDRNELPDTVVERGVVI